MANQATLLIKIFGPFADLSSEMANFFNQTFSNIASSSGTGGKNSALYISKEIGTLKFVFSKKATKIDEIFTADLTLTT